MKITLLTINAKYVHSSLAVWFLTGGVKKHCKQNHEVSITETTINQDINGIAEQVASQNPDLVGISTYIWNIGKLPELLKLLRQRLPETVIVLGGPEASNNAEYWLKNGADYVLRGGGGILIVYLTAFASVSQLKAQGINLLFFIPVALLSMIIYRKNGLVDWKKAVPAALAGAAGVAVGFSVTLLIDEKILSKVFAGLLILISLFEFFGNSSKTQES